ncbi:MAG TPA: hypothetical protein DEF41_01085 [Desulfovibrio sp.]|uniref:Uncharacterized protein n=1 Tax=Nitratidesulfovibrio vulgaris (strain ATCC 29579 / DSM 644 / CCUG 34227 / NCIMB 8303 / VKM B-1760 / Hildenborough) TaxID=882 RepID=Q72DQ2_NITV2|nr:hypothetical protein DVU_0877 [Nitratidesulfovibrio vulgaris str. Hildenborough]HBW14752.1 hypothetical protein [Desulfovibrio sp.]
MSARMTFRLTSHEAAAYPCDETSFTVASRDCLIMPRRHATSAPVTPE